MIELRHFSTQNDNPLSQEQLQNRLNLYLSQIPTLFAPIDYEGLLQVNQECSTTPVGSPQKATTPEIHKDLWRFNQFSKSLPNSSGSSKKSEPDESVTAGGSTLLADGTKAFEADDEASGDISNENDTFRSSTKRRATFTPPDTDVSLGQHVTRRNGTGRPVKRISLETETTAVDTTTALDSFTPSELYLGIGAIYRIIPPPWKLSHQPSPTSLPVSTSTRTTEIRHFFVPIPSDYFQFGRGSWLLPINGALNIDGASAASWSTNYQNQRINSKRVIFWTDERLSEVWKRLVQLNESGALGDVQVICSVENLPTNKDLAAQSASHSLRTNNSMTDHIRISVDCSRALALRVMLSRFNIRGQKILPVGPEGVVMTWIDNCGKVMFLA